jgi:hypothetical protein
VGNFPDGGAVKSLAGEEFLRGAFDLAPVLGDGIVEKLGHSFSRARHQGERSLLLANTKTQPHACQENFVAGAGGFLGSVLKAARRIPRWSGAFATTHMVGQWEGREVVITNRSNPDGYRMEFNASATTMLGPDDHSRNRSCGGALPMPPFGRILCFASPIRTHRLC